MISVTKQGDLKIKERFEALKDWESKLLAGDLGDLAHDHFLEAFPTGNGAKGGKKTDETNSGWKQRTNLYNHPVNNDTGRLKGSIKVRKMKRRAVVSTNVRYAGYVNRQREFIGKSRKLELKSRKYIRKGLNSIFNNNNPSISRYKK